MTRTRARSMATAPLDGTIVLVRCGLGQTWIEAYWMRAMQGWVASQSWDLKVLHNVTAWRPLL